MSRCLNALVSILCVKIIRASFYIIWWWCRPIHSLLTNKVVEKFKSGKGEPLLMGEDKPFEVTKMPSCSCYTKEYIFIANIIGNYFIPNNGVILGTQEEQRYSDIVNPLDAAWLFMIMFQAFKVFNLHNNPFNKLTECINPVEIVTNNLFREQFSIHSINLSHSFYRIDSCE